MTPTTPASVVVVGHGRPAALARCLTALRLQDHPVTELVVVTCAAGAAVVATLGLDGRAKVLNHPPGNRALARNLGLQAAAGEVVAFTTDDAVAEPPWLGRLVATFADPQVEAAVGGVRDADGSLPAPGADWVDATGRIRPLAIEGTEPSLHMGAPGSAVHLPGAAMAFRRETLAAMGGFDPAFRLAMGTRDLALRLAAQQMVTAIVPLAQVQRSAAGAPEPGATLRADLPERGAALALFLRKHAPRIDPAPSEAALRAAQRPRLLRAMVDGTIMPADVDRLLERLAAGLSEGRAREIAPLLPIGPPADPFLPLPGTGPRPARVVAGWGWQSRRLARQARAFAAEGAVVTLLHLRPGFAAHRTAFAEAGHWTHSGGLWGRGPGRGRPRARLRATLTALAPIRPVDTLLD